jgi:hypothetical protein
MNLPENHFFPGWVMKKGTYFENEEERRMLRYPQYQPGAGEREQGRPKTQKVWNCTSS